MLIQLLFFEKLHFPQVRLRARKWSYVSESKKQEAEGKLPLSHFALSSPVELRLD